MDNQPHILHCPKCKNRRDNVNLGSVSPDGYVIFQRKFGRHTMVMAQNYSIICDCGYSIHVENGKIVTSGALTGIMPND